MKNSGFLSGFLIVGAIGVSAWLLQPILFPFCDQAAKARALQRYEARMTKAGYLSAIDVNTIRDVEGKKLDTTDNWDVGVDAAVDLYRELDACHCAEPNPVEEILNRFKRPFKAP